jgi:opacity protein-like surface antigen
MIGSHFSIGIEDRQWLDEAGVQGDKIRGNIQNVNLVLTVYPGSTKNLTSGFILQAGIGIAQARLSLLEPFEGGKNEWGETHEVIAKTDEGGSGWLVGAGYEIRVSSHFAAGATVTFNSLTFDDQIFDTVEFIPGGLHLNWYF